LHLIIKLVINGHLVGTHKGDWARLTDSIVTAEVFFGTIILDKMRVAHCCSLVSSCTNNRIDRCRRCTNNRIDRCRRCTLPVAAAALPVAAAALPATAAALPATAATLPATAAAAATATAPPATAAALPATAAFAEFVDLIIKLSFSHGFGKGGFVELAIELVFSHGFH